MTVAPTLAEQIEAIEWAETMLEALTATPEQTGPEIMAEIEICRPRLLAAAETMRTWEFAREVLK